TCVIDGAALANAGHHILQDAALLGVEENIIGCNCRHVGLRCKICERMQTLLIAGAAAQGESEISAIAKSFGKAPQFLGAIFVGPIRDKDGDQTFAMIYDIIKGKRAAALAGAALAKSKQAAKPRIGGAVCWIDEKHRAICQIEAAANDQPDAARLGRLMRAHDAGERITVRDRERLDAEPCRLGKKLRGA